MTARRMPPGDRRVSRRAAAGCILVCAVTLVAFAEDVVHRRPAAGTREARKPGARRSSRPGDTEDAGDPQVKRLKAIGIAPDARSLRAYLNSIRPDGDWARRQKRLIEQLGDRDYRVREAALKAFLRLPQLNTDLLKKAASARDPEIRWRAREVLRRGGEQSAGTLHAAYAVIARRKLPGLAAEVLATMSLCDEPYLRQSAARALAATARRKDAALLKARLDDETLYVRLAAIRACEAALGKDADGILRRLAKDKNDVVKAEAARAMLEHGNRDALSLFGDLLDSSELPVRARAVRVLRAVSGKRFHFVAYEPPETRAAASDAWRKWIAVEGRTVALILPLKTQPVEIGRTLYCDYENNRVVELDAAGRPKSSHPVARHPWGCQGLPNGHRLVASYDERRVTEYDAKWNVVWARVGLPGGPTSVERLENGNTLIACTDSGRVVEVDRKSRIVWDVMIAGRPTDAHRLANGRTLICLQNAHRVVEVDRGGEEKWQITGVISPFSADRLENGNTLVACMGGGGGVYEYDPTGTTVVWSFREGMSYTRDAQRLSNGHTLISDNTGLREVDRAKHVVWHRPMSGVSRLHRY